MGVSQSQPSAERPMAPTPAPEPAAAWDYEIVNRFGVTISTASTEDLARATAFRLSRQFAGLRVERVQRIEVRETIYRPRGLAA